MVSFPEPGFNLEFLQKAKIALASSPFHFNVTDVKKDL